MSSISFGTGAVSAYRKYFSWRVATLGVVLLGLVFATWVWRPWRFISQSTSQDSLGSDVAVWAIGSLLCFIFAIILYYRGTLIAPLQTPNPGIVFSIFWALAVAVLILVLIFSMKEVEAVNGIFSALAGAVLGWLLGMYISPEGTDEQQQFAKIGTSVVALFSGYSLKMVVDWLQKSGSEKYRPYCGLLALSAAISAAAVYSSRAYGRKAVKISPPSGREFNPGERQKMTVTAPADLAFTASVTGVTDTSVAWQIVSSPDRKTADITNGRFVGKDTGLFTVLARSNFDPTMADSVVVEVLEAKLASPTPAPL